MCTNKIQGTSIDGMGGVKAVKVKALSLEMSHQCVDVYKVWIEYHLRNKIWVTVVYQLINNCLEFWCVGINHASRIHDGILCFYFYSNMIKNELKGYTSAESKLPETLTFNYRSMPSVPESTVVYIGWLTPVILFIVYKYKNANHVRISFLDIEAML